MVATGVLSIRMAARALDSKIFTMIPAALAMGLSMQVTGGAQYLAQNLIDLLQGAAPAVVLSAFFLLIAGLSNIISAKAAAVLFTPIAVGIAHELGVPVEAFAVAVVFAANCAIATPIGYQTSLLVMGPGHYTFGDFARGGIPLIFVLWLTFSFFAPWYYGL
jgi:di/tricarboxylate transporter